MIKYKCKYELTKKDGDIGYDLRSVNTKTINPLQTKTIDTSLQVELPKGTYIDVRGRSGLNSKGIIAHLGLVDTSYRGKIMVTITNLTNQDFTINKGDRIAQIVFKTEQEHELKKVQMINENTDRGQKGFGSSGLK